MIKQIQGFPNYGIDKNGNVHNIKYNRPLKQCYSGTGYKVVYLMSPDGGRKTKLIHRLLLETFVDECPINMEGCHNDGDKLNNKISNLRWDTHKGNELDKVKHGTIARGSRSNWAKLKEQDVRMIVYIWNTGLFTQYEIANIYNVDHANISAIVLRKSWKHLWEK